MHDLKGKVNGEKSLCHHAMHNPTDGFINEHNNDGGSSAFYDIHGSHGNDDKRHDILDSAIDGRSHGDDFIQRHAVQLCKLGSKYTPLNKVPNTAMMTVPKINPVNA